MKVHGTSNMSGTSLRVLIALLFFVFSLVAAQDAAAFRNVKIGEIAPAFSLEAVDGGMVDFAAPPEVVVVLAFVKQGQEKSEKVIKALNSLDEVFADKVQPVVVLLNPADGDALKWAEGTGAQYPILLDKDQTVYGVYGVMVAPEVAVIAPDGTFKHEMVGFTSGFDGELDSHLRDTLGMEQKEDRSAAVPDEIPEARKKAMKEVAKAKMLIKRKMKSKAISQLEKALVSDETYPEGHQLMGELLMDEGGEENLSKAEKHFNRLGELDPKNQMVKIGLARVKAARGDTEGAITTLVQAAKISPKPEKLYYYLGQTYEKSGDLKGAVDSYKKALEKFMSH